MRELGDRFLDPRPLPQRLHHSANVRRSLRRRSRIAAARRETGSMRQTCPILFLYISFETCMLNLRLRIVRKIPLLNKKRTPNMDTVKLQQYGQLRAP